MDNLEKALRVTFNQLNKEELVDLLCMLIKDSLHHAGRKKTSKPSSRGKHVV